MNNARKVKGTSLDTDIVIENKTDTPPLKPIQRFTDFFDNDAFPLNYLENEAGLSFWAKNYSALDEPEVFGVNDPVDRDEFLKSLRHLTKFNGHSVFPNAQAYHVALKATNPDVDYTSTPITFKQAYNLMDAAMTRSFGNTYRLCSSYDTQFFTTKLVQISKKEQGFTDNSSRATKYLFASGAILSNNETAGTMTRRQSLVVYHLLDLAIKRGGVQCETSN